MERLARRKRHEAGWLFGHDSQCFGVEEYRLVGGRGDGPWLLEVCNGLGLEFSVSVDRGCDISRLTCGGLNYGFFPQAAIWGLPITTIA